MRIKTDTFDCVVKNHIEIDHLRENFSESQITIFHYFFDIYPVLSAIIGEEWWLVPYIGYNYLNREVEEGVEFFNNDAIGIGSNFGNTRFHVVNGTIRAKVDTRYYKRDIERHHMDYVDQGAWEHATRDFDSSYCWHRDAGYSEDYDIATILPRDGWEPISDDYWRAVALTVAKIDSKAAKKRN